MHDHQSTPAQVPLVTKPWGLLKTLRTARRNLLEVIPEMALHRPILSGKTGVRWHLLMDPKAIRRVLKENVDNYPKSASTKNILKPAIGEGLFLAEGAHWRWQRRAMAPVFSARNIANLAPIMTKAAEASYLRLAAHDGQQADVFEEMITATFEVIAEVCFSGVGSLSRDGVHQAVDAYLKQAAKVSLFDMIGAPNWVPRPGRIFNPNALNRLKHLASSAVEGRRLQGASTVPDLLDLLLAGEDPETHRQMNTAELRDNLLTFVIAGHETTALSLCWSLYLLAFDPEVQAKVRAEAALVLGQRFATAADVPNLPYTRQVIEESLRLYSPAAFLSRTAQAADTLCGRDIKRGDIVVLPLYALHRNHLLWPDPHRFNPDRFARPHAIDRYAYLPFLDGPRVCIGAQFAMTEAVIVLASLVAKLQFALVPGAVPKPTLVLTLRPAGGIQLKITKL